jgi:hypothetical protein
MSSAITNSALSAGIRLRCRNSAYADSHDERTAAVKKQRLLFLYNDLHIFHHQSRLVFGPQAASMSSPSEEPPSASATEHLQSKEGWQMGPSSMIILKPID